MLFVLSIFLFYIAILEEIMMSVYHVSILNLPTQINLSFSLAR